MKRCLSLLCFWVGLMTSATAAVNVIVSGGILRDANGAPLAPGSLVAVVASTQDNAFGVPTPSAILQAGTRFGDDVVLAVFPVSAQTSGVNGGFVGMVSFDYAALGIANLNAGDPLKLYWFPASGLNGAQLLSSAAYGAFRTDTLASRSNTPWSAPDDSSGGTFELNFTTQAAGGDAANSDAIAAFTVAGSNDVTVAATSPVAAEPATSGTFTFTRTGGTSNALTVNFTVGGSATSGSDYASLGTSVTFPVGSSTVTRSVNVIDDTLIEGAETVTLTLANGAGYSIGNPATATVTIQDDDAGGSATAYVTGATLGTLRNNFDGWVGIQFTVGANALTVTELGRGFAPGNTGNHTVKLVRASDGLDVPGGTAVVATASGTGGQYRYAALSNSVTLAANTSYWILSQENSGGDLWYDWDTTITTTSAAVADGLAWGFGPGSWYTYAIPNRTHALLNFKYTVGTVPPPPPPTESAYVTAAVLGTLRNNFEGWVGIQFTVGANALTVTELGRGFAPGNTGNHTVKLVRASDGLDVPGGTAVVATASGTGGQYRYAALSNSITLAANTTYWILSQENSGGDLWYDWDTTITTTTAAVADGLAWGFGPGSWYTYAIPNRTHALLNFKYTVGTVPPPPPPTESAYVTSAVLGTLRNNFEGWVGIQFTVGANALTVTELGRGFAPGNTGNHTVKLVRASDGLDVPGGTAVVATASGTGGQYRYAALSNSITLAANTTYWILSRENSGGDLWYDWDTTITTTSAAVADGLAWGFGPGSWYTYAIPNRTHALLNFKYTVGAAGTASLEARGVLRQLNPSPGAGAPRREEFIAIAGSGPGPFGVRATRGPWVVAMGPTTQKRHRNNSSP